MNLPDLGAHGLYVWGSLAMCLVVVAMECAALRARSRAMKAHASGPLTADAPATPRQPPRLTQEAGHAVVQKAGPP